MPRNTVRTIDAEVFILIDAKGEYAIGADAAEAWDAYKHDVGELTACSAFRLVKLTLPVPLPAIAAEADRPGR